MTFDIMECLKLMIKNKKTSSKLPYLSIRYFKIMNKFEIKSKIYESRT